MTIPEDYSKLTTLSASGSECYAAIVEESLRKDCIILFRNLTRERTDEVTSEIADRFGLLASLEVQAAFAGFRGHRSNVGKYFMTVNQRGDYQFVPPHSEGDSTTNLELAFFYCFENSTDGGETIFMNVNSAAENWIVLRERVVKVKPGSRVLTHKEAAKAKALYDLRSQANQVTDDDLVMDEIRTTIPDLSLIEVLVKPRQTYTRLLDRESYAYWDSMASIDYASLAVYVQILQESRLLREPTRSFEIKEMDNAAHRRRWHSGINHAELFNCKVTLRLNPGDLIVQNNMSWTHAVANWTPGSGVRRVVAAFA